MKGNKKVMVVGLDGATFDLIKPWADEGKLPTFRKVMNNGVFGDLKSTIPFCTIPAWPSFSTGCNPGKHGFYDFFKAKDNGYEWTVEIFPSKAVMQPTLWEILSQNDKKVAVINVPSTYPPTQINGFMITGMLTPPGVNYTYPSNFQKELLDKIGTYNVFFSALSAKNPSVLLSDLKSTLNTRIKALEYLWKEKKPNFLMVVDNGTDRAEHELWKFLDPINPLHNPKDVKMFNNPLLEYYQYVDESLQKIINIIGEDVTLILMSDHGQGPLRKFVNLNIFLIDTGFMKVKRNVLSALRYKLFNLGFSPRTIYNILRKIGIERYASDRVDQRKKLALLNRLFFSTSDIDWSNSVAFSSGVVGAITINLKDRQLNGVVSSGDEYENVRTQIIEKLRQLKDPQTGNMVINHVYRREEIYDGAYLEKAPDIIAIPNDSYEFFGMHGFSFHKIIMPTFVNSGGHRSNGIFIAYGKGIRKGTEIINAKIVDIAPTILHLMDIPIPSNMDGKILYDIFKESSEVISRKPKYIKYTKFKENEAVKLISKIQNLKKNGKI
jgi:predicted AlkP superfamily phosphohydrolase/phosphomutase